MSTIIELHGKPVRVDLSDAAELATHYLPRCN
jgi:hypothetical protein